MFRTKYKRTREKSEIQIGLELGVSLVKEHWCVVMSQMKKGPSDGEWLHENPYIYGNPQCLVGAVL
jgi:hypothetical protein